MVDFFDALQKHGKKAGIGGMRMAADINSMAGFLHTGNFALNWILSGRFITGGWPLGYVTEIFGDNSSGKSFLVARAIAQILQDPMAVAVLDDTEHAFNSVWASAKLGVDTSRLVHVSSPHVEAHAELVLAFVKAFKESGRTKGLLANDSIALLSTKDEIEAGIDKENMKRAKKIKQFFRLVKDELAAIPVAYLVTNHTIATMDVFNPVDTPGGGGTKFHATIRVALRKPKRLKNANGQYVGVMINAFVEKNRIVSPWRKADLIVPFFQEIQACSGLIRLLLELKVLEIPDGKRNLFYQSVDTGIAAQKSDPWKQDEAGLTLLEKFPTLLQDLDKQDLAANLALGPMIAPDDDDE